MGDSESLLSSSAASRSYRSLGVRGPGPSEMFRGVRENWTPAQTPDYVTLTIQTLIIHTWRSVWQRRTEAVHVPGVQEAAGGELGRVGARAGAPVLAPQLPHLLTPVLHQRLVL